MANHLDLVVTVHYYGPKARQFYSGSIVAMSILREDLLALKLPHPKKENTIFKSLPGGKGECSFMWSSVPPRNVLHKNLTARITSPEEVVSRKRILKELSICRLGLQEYPGGTIISSMVYDSRSNSFNDTRAKAQMLLDDMASELRKPKTEPLEPTLPDSPVSSKDSARSSIPSPPAPAQWDAPMSISPSRYSNPPPIKVLVESPVIPPAPLSPEDSDPMPPGLIFSTRRSRFDIALPSEVTTPCKRPRSQSPDLWSRPISRTYPGSMNGSFTKVDELKDELASVRRDIEAKLAREASIIAEMRALGASAPTRESPEEAALRARLNVVAEQLSAETRSRLVTEAVLLDFQRECKEPFIVPAMFDMVETISRLTTQTMEAITKQA